MSILNECSNWAIHGNGGFNKVQGYPCGSFQWGKFTSENMDKECCQPEQTSPFDKNFSEAIRTMVHAVHENAKAHGWWDDPREDGTVCMLIVTEIAEAVEALRNGDPESVKIPGFTHAEEEMADAVIRIFDFAGRHGFNLGKAILAKHQYNLTRSYKHGGKKF